MRHLKLTEVCDRLDLDEQLLVTLEEEGVIEVKRTLEGELVVSEEDAERLRLICLLLREFDVNLQGAEIIVEMKEQIIALQHQFDEILRALVEEVRRRSGRS